MTKRNRGWIALTLAVFFLPYAGWAWDPYGHMMVAQVAYDHLNPKAKAAVDALSPEVKYPGINYDFITVSTWMDDLRGEGPDIPFSGQFKPWHFITWGLDPKDANPPLELGDDADSKKGNVVIGLKRAVAVLKGGTDPEIPDKAHALAIVAHLTGDAHQPLHCASHFYKNDKDKIVNDGGGNRVMIDNAPEVPYPDKPMKMNLHAYWDGAYRAKFDNKTNMVVVEPAYANYKVKDLELLKGLMVGLEKYAPEKDVSLEPDFAAWAKESNAIARDFAYAKLPRFEKDKYANVDDLYTIKAVELAKARIVLAGYRLAALLNSTLGADAPAAETPAPEVKQ